jgi:SAM-dependent methyltransferase
LHELPILTGSIDLVMLPHTLEFVDNARQLLAEACRIVKPEGLIAICGFNPYSAWGLRKAFTKHKTPPWSGNFIYSYKIKNWLQLVGFEMEKQQSILFRPPISRPELFQKLQFLEYIGSKCFPMLGGVYILLARAKVIPLIPIRMQWKQQLSGIRLPAKMPGHIARHSK